MVSRFILALLLMVDLKINLDVNERYVPLLNDTTREQHIFGGSSSGKSFFLIGQRMILDLLGGQRNYLCIRNVARTLRDSIYNEVLKGINRAEINDLFTINQTDMTITCANGCQAIMKGMDDVEKIKSITPRKGPLTDILIEEATEVVDRGKIKQLKRRLRGESEVPKRITYIYNPIYKTHWICQDFFAGRWNDGDTYYKDENLLIMKTTYKDNLKHLESDDIAELENEKDSYWYNVFTLGNWGVIGQLVFNNWKTQDLKDVKDRFGDYYNGLDFGYANDPAACTRSAIKGKTLYITHEPVYEKGLTNDVLAVRIGPAIGNGILRCDPADPKSIVELRNYGIKGAMPAAKGPGSVLFGIQHLQQYEIIIDTECQNTINEFSIYQWEKDKDGNYINKPVDKNNHAIDSIRYAHDANMVPASVAVTDKSALGIF